MKDLRVVYDGEKVNVELDVAIENILKQFGFTRWASGYNFCSGKRDLAFEKK